MIAQQTLRVEFGCDEAVWSQELAGSSFESWNWKVAQEAVGRRVETVRVLDVSGTCVAKTLLVFLPGPLQMPIVLSPRGPVFAEAIQDNAAACTAVLESLVIEITQKYPEALCWRFEPNVEKTAVSWPVFPGMRVHDVQPAWTRLLSLSGATEESLLAAMKQKTRYNIRLSEKKGVVVEQLFRDSCSVEQWNAAVEQWIALQDATAQRHGIKHHGAEYYRALLGAQWDDRFVSVLQARFDNQIIAMTVLLTDRNNQTVTYLFGASSDAHTNVMAPYALQWKAIQYALTSGFKTYDFYGIAPDAQESGHPLSAVTRFKNGFGGSVAHYPGTFDFPIRRVWYRIYRLVKYFR